MLKLSEPLPAFACQHRLTAFFDCLDTADYDGVISHFSPDGAWTRRGTALQGPAAIRAAMEERDLSIDVRHVMSNAVAYKDGNKIALNCYVTAYRGPRVEGQPIQMDGPTALYLFKATLTFHLGEWLIETLAGRPIFRRSPEAQK